MPAPKIAVVFHSVCANTYLMAREYRDAFRELGAQVESVCRSAGLGFTYESEVESLLTTGDERLLRRLPQLPSSNQMQYWRQHCRLI